VQVVNNGTAPIAGWQIVIALPADTVTSIRNADGYVSHGILLLQPASAASAASTTSAASATGAAQVVPPHGGTLNVFFTAAGTQTGPEACAFNGILCR